MAKEQQVRDGSKIVMNPTTVVPYPSKELANLKEITEYDGVIKTIYDNTGITAPTVRKVLDEGTGQFRVVTALRDFVVKYNKQTA